MYDLNEFNFKKMRPEKEKGNVPSTSSNLSLNDKTTIPSTRKETKRFNHSMIPCAEGAKQNHLEDKKMNGNQDKEINNVSLFHRQCYTEHAQNETPEKQKNTPAKKSESDIVFLKPKIYPCCHCNKIFFHTSTYKRHMIYQLKKLY